MDLIKVQLKDLFRFSEDSQYISDDVVAVVREHQRSVADSGGRFHTVLFPLFRLLLVLSTSKIERQTSHTQTKLPEVNFKNADGWMVEKLAEILNMIGHNTKPSSAPLPSPHRNTSAVTWLKMVFCSSLKCRATKLCSECESELRNVLQDPLLIQAQWSYKVSEVLASSADVTDFPRVAVMVQTIQVRTLKAPPLPLRSSSRN